MGTLLAGRYDLVKPLGSGGFGQTFLANDHHLPGKPICVVKQFKPQARDPRSLQTAKRLFDLEAQTLYQLGNHDQIPRLFAHFEQDGEFYLVQEFIEGVPFHQILNQRKQLSEAEGVALLRDILQVLAFVHQHNVIHRDIKPSNLIWRKRDGKIALIDFGAVKQVSVSTVDQSGQTSFTVAIGSPGYMPVEQHSSQPRFSSDIYAVGMVALQALTGLLPKDLPIDPKTGEISCDLLADRLPISPGLAAILDTMVRYDYRQRYQNAAEALRALEHLSDRAEPVDAIYEALLPKIADLPLNFSPQTSAPTFVPNGYTDPHKSLPETRLSALRPTLRASQRRRLSRRSTTGGRTHPSSRDHRNRQALLNKVANYWVKGVLETSLHDQVLIALGVEHRPDAVASPWNVTLQSDHQSPTTLPPGTHIVSVFDEIGVGRTLLILGEPGAGKTTTLLQLARDLIARAQYDASVLIPVILNLSSWSCRTQTIADWIVQELNTKYQVPKKVGQSWVEQQQLLLLLDGLDEIRLEHREACVAALNAFQQDYSTEMVVCSRIRDYEALSNRLNFQSAIYLRSLTPEQIQTYLNRLTTDVTALKTLLKEDAALRELAQSPLLLNIMVLAYQGVTAEDLPRIDTVEERRRQLFDTYIDRMFRRRDIAQRYSKAQTLHWLSWLACKLIQQSQTIFLIERLQPTWLETKWQRAIQRIVAGLIAGLLVGLGYGLISQFGIGLIESLQADGVKTLAARMLNGLIIAIVAGPVFGLAIGGLSPEIKPVETLKWSWKEARKSLLFWMSFGFVVGLGGGAIVGLLDLLLSGGQVGGFMSALIGQVRWLDGCSGLIAGLIYGLTRGLGGLEVETRSSPNQAILMSVKSARVFGFAGGVVGGLAGGMVGGLIDKTTDGLMYGLSAGLVTGLIGGGGLACIEHFTLRFILFCQHSAPWNYARFLNYAAERIFLQKVGGGYIFIHRLLMEHFAHMRV